MKKTLPLLAAFTCAVSPIFAQGPDSSPAASSTPAAPVIPGPPASHAGIGVITPDEREALMAANKKAEQDPAVIAAKQKVTDAMKGVRALIVAKDPTLAPVLDRMEAAAATPGGAANLKLTPEEREKLTAARKSVTGTPESATLDAAVNEYREARRTAMSADPAVAAIFARFRNARPADTLHPATPLATPAPAASPTP